MHWDVSFLWSNRFNKLKKIKTKIGTLHVHMCVWEDIRWGVNMGSGMGEWEGVLDEW